MGEEKEILLRGKVCAYWTDRLMGDTVFDCLTVLSYCTKQYLVSSRTDVCTKDSAGVRLDSGSSNLR